MEDSFTGKNIIKSGIAALNLNGKSFASLDKYLAAKMCINPNVAIFRELFQSGIFGVFFQ